MEIKRFFINQENMKNDILIINNDEYNHIIRVLRYKIGYKLIICTGDGYDYYATIKDIDSKRIICSLDKKELNKNNSKIEVNLFAAIIKEDNYELMVQKAVELGVNSITPIITEYVNEKKLRINRLIKIAKDASKQCERATLAKINQPLRLNDAIIIAKKAELTLMAYENEREQHLSRILLSNKDKKTISVFIGPEGGYSDTEKDLMDTYSVEKFTLGRRILRAETASIVTLANIMYELDR